MNPLLIIAAASALKYLNDRQAVRRQEQLRGAMEQYQRQRAADNEATASRFAATNAPDQRAADLAAITADRQKSLENTVQSARATDVPQISGKLSPDYVAAQARASDTVSNRVKRAIQQLAIMGAPGEQGLSTGIRYGRAAGNVDANNIAMRNVGEGYTTDIGNVRPNPFVDLLAQAGMGYGIGSAMAPRVTNPQPNLISPMSADWGSLDAGPGAYSTRTRNALSLWGR